MIWYMLGVFIAFMLLIAYLIDQWADALFNPEKINEPEAKR